VLSVGLVVDDAIVVVENVERHLSEGQTPIEAALLGARELVGPIIAMTLTLAAVYAPIGLQGGLTGSLFREFAFTLSGAVIISGVVALTLSPMMSAKMLKPGIEEHGLAKIIADYFKRLRTAYGRWLDVTLNARPTVYTVWIILSLLTIPMFIMSPAELAPLEDEGAIFSIIDAPANSALELTSHFTTAADKIFQSIPETDFTFQITFPSGGFGGLITKPWNERKRTTMQILPEVQQKLRAIPGIKILPITPPALP
jgi:multidrug efflux pump